MISTTPVVPKHEFEEGTGWELKPEGACKGEVCIPLPGRDRDHVDIRQIAAVMRLPLVRDDTHGVWALGPEPDLSANLGSAEAPELVLPDLEGRQFKLSSLRGEKVVLVAWAPY